MEHGDDGEARDTGDRYGVRRRLAGDVCADVRLFLFTAKVKLHEELARGNCMVKISEVGFKGLHKVHRRGKLIYPMYNY